MIAGLARMGVVDPDVDLRPVAAAVPPPHAMNLHSFLTRLLEDVATVAVDTHVRRDLLTDVLAPLGPAGAERVASRIEQHAYWIRCGCYANGEDLAFGAAVDQAAGMAAAALTSQAAGSVPFTRGGGAA